MNGFRRHPLALTGLTLLVALAIAGGLAAFPAQGKSSSSTYGHLKLFTEVLALVRSNYVETVSEEELLRGAYEGLLSSLDGESEYLSAKEFQTMQVPRAETEGVVGIALTRREGIIFVASVHPDSDAQAKGLRVGDHIRRLSNQVGRSLSLSQAQRILRGAIGSTVSLEISRREEPRRETVEVLREHLDARMPVLISSSDGVGVIEIQSFEEGSSEAVARILEKLAARKIERVVLDLRGNTFGSPGEAAKSASLLVGKGVIAKLQERGGRETKLQGPGPRGPWKGKVAILTDPGTAFTAEIFVAALLDSGMATHLGEQTLGRGGEREALPLANGDFLYLTVRRYVSPSGKAWHGDGMKPSVRVPQDFDAPLEKRDSLQLQKAVDWFLNPSEEAEAA
jgi:carboxyl-terminal processing protease